MAIAPPTKIATIGTKRPPKFVIDSMALTTRYLLDWQLPVSEILVELTGIEPVASWLQTRRSPS
jgi:hypothetical protein